MAKRNQDSIDPNHGKCIAFVKDISQKIDSIINHIPHLPDWKYKRKLP